MAGDFEDLYDIERLSDREQADLIREELGAHADLDAAWVEVDVDGGRVTVRGRVGTEAEYQEVESVLMDLLGLRTVSNELVVDELVRAEHAEAADEANVEVYGRDSASSGAADRTEDTAEHLLPDSAGEQFGTRDVREAVERGYSYTPPMGPMQEGTRSRENH